MAGRCDATNLLKSTPAEVDFQIRWDIDMNIGERGGSSNGEFLPLQPQISPGLDMHIFGPEMALAHSIAPRLKKLRIKRAHFVKFALGSTNLYSNWNPSNSVTKGKASEIGYCQSFSEFCRESLKALQTNEESPIKIERPLWGMF